MLYCNEDVVHVVLQLDEMCEVSTLHFSLSTVQLLLLYVFATSMFSPFNLHRRAMFIRLCRSFRNGLNKQKII